jgi:hypothetical protein
MMNQTERIIGGVTLHTDRPTRLPMRDLFAWVIWQFPRPREDGFCGAVHYPAPGQGWLPAIVCADKGAVHVYGHLTTTYDTPETAVEYFSTEKEKKTR